MEDRVDAVERALDRVGVADVAADQLHVGVEIVGAAPRFAVNLGIEIVEDPNFAAALQKRVGQMRPDETRTSAHFRSPFFLEW